MKNSALKRKRIGVIYGGSSAERKVSLITGRAVLSALKRLGYNAAGINAGKDLPYVLKKKKIEVVFNAMHGGFGENGCIQGMLELLRIPYTGSGVLSSSLGMNKIASKKIFLSSGIPTPDFVLVTAGDEIMDLRLDYPAVVKPVNEGSSIGVSIVKGQGKLMEGLDNAFKYSTRAIVEKYIDGKEITVGILDREPLGAMEVIPKGGFLDYTTKYTPGMEEFIMPAPLKNDAYDKCLDIAFAAHNALHCSGYSRVDARFTPDGRIYILEVNTLPGLTGLSYLPKIAEYRGINYEGLVERILLSAGLKGE
ncbi:MAG TPA: D-alanine--D-alanine ligase [bacterium]